MAFTWKQAAVKVLRDFGREARTQEILDEILSSGIKSTRGQTPLLTLRTELYRACIRQGDFTRPAPDILFYEAGDDYWGLIEWRSHPVTDSETNVNKGSQPSSDSDTQKSDKKMENTIWFAPEDDEEAFPEGKEVYRLHRTRERNPKVAELAKTKRLKKDPSLHCEVCAFSFVEIYGELGESFIEAHHTIPLSDTDGEIETHIEDIALVCSNCHKMLHRRRPWLAIGELKEMLSKHNSE